MEQRNVGARESRPLSAVPVRRTADEVADVLRQAIVVGAFVPGERLVEAELAAQLGTSRTPIRRALAVLETEGLVVAEPHHGARVRVLDSDDLSDMYEIRALLEGHAAMRASERADDADVEALNRSCDRMATLSPERDGLSAIVEENLTFHQSVMTAAGSPRLRQFVISVAQRPLMYHTVVWFTAAEYERSCARHEEIAAAIGAGDGAGAATAMRAHLLEGRDVLLRHVGQDNRESSIQNETVRRTVVRPSEAPGKSVEAENE